MNQNCFLCDNSGAQITDRPNGYDGKHVICLKCTHYRISRNGVNNIIHGRRVPTFLSDKVKSYFEKTGEPFEINTITLSLL